MAKRIELVGIDWQNDFCTPAGKFPGMPTGALLVPGAYEAGERVAGLIDKIGTNFADLRLTMDMHQRLHIAHPEFWKDTFGAHPKPFTAITVEDVEQGRWLPARPSMGRWCLDYVRSLKASGRYALVIWPPHCLAGTPGAALIPPIQDAIHRWALNRFATITFVIKGSNFRTEHYSAWKAEVTDPTDPTTQLNVDQVRSLEECDELVWTGIAGDYCLFNSMRDAFDNFGPDAIKKSVLLKDGQASIDPGNFEKLIAPMVAKGLRVTTIADYLA